MRKLLLGLLVGTVALTPALASAQVRERAPDEERAERQQRRAERQAERAERRAERADSPTPAQTTPPPAPERETRRERRFDGDGERFARPDRMAPRPDGQSFPARRDRDEAGRDARREWRDDRRQDRRDWRDDRRDNRREWRADRRDDRDRRDEGGWGRNAYRGGLVWNRGWRDDRRYDWNGYRQGNRGLYRLPRYYAPEGYGYQYRRYGVGVSLGRALYDQDYWIDDPFDYRLPPAYGPYRWVRYYGDALLVDLRTGRVVDVVHDIFY